MMCERIARQNLRSVSSELLPENEKEVPIYYLKLLTSNMKLQKIKPPGKKRKH